MKRSRLANAAAPLKSSARLALRYDELKSVSYCWVAFVMAMSLSACSIDAVVDRPVNKDDIRETIKAHQKDIRLCYESALEQTPMLEGRIVMDWSIGSDGHPKDLKVRDASPKIQPVVPCLTESMKTWVFRNTNPDSVVTVSYPFIFSENSQFERVRKETAPASGDGAIKGSKSASPAANSPIAPAAPKGAKDSKTE